MEEAVRLGFESFPSQIPVLTDRFLFQFMKHLFLPSSNARQRYMHIHYYGNATFEEAMAAVQPPQFQLASHPSCLVPQEILSDLFHRVLNISTVMSQYSGENSLTQRAQPGQQVQSSVSQWLLLHPPSCSTHLALMGRIPEVHKFSSCLEPNQ